MGIKYMYSKWEDLEKAVSRCKKCPLSETRLNVVFGEGSKKAKLMFIGEGPGADEDMTGCPFVGRAGQLLRRIFTETGIKKENIYITNIIKCRAPQNRNPRAEEIEACLDYLRNQVILIKPKVIVLLGSFALKTVLGNEYFITEARGKIHEKKGIKYLPTFHPSAALRDPNKKPVITEDLRLALSELDK